METMATNPASKIHARAPRVMVQLSPEARVLLDRMTAATGQPKSSLISELVDAGLPAVANALEAIEHAKAGRVEEASRLMSRFAHEATAQLAQQQLQLEQVVDARTIAGKRAKRRGSSGRATP
jgi:predicted DNA-binding protein